MKIAPVAEVKARLSSYLKACEDGPVVVTRNGRAVAALVSVVDDEDLERLVLAHSPRLQSILQAGRQEIGESGGLSHDELWAEVEAESAL